MDIDIEEYASYPLNEVAKDVLNDITERCQVASYCYKAGWDMTSINSLTPQCEKCYNIVLFREVCEGLVQTIYIDNDELEKLQSDEILNVPESEQMGVLVWFERYTVCTHAN